MMSRLLLISSVLLSLVYFCVAATYPCTYTSQATQKNYDLSNAYRDPSKGQKDFTTIFPNDQSTFNVNVCGQSAAACNPANGVCQQTTGNAFYGNGDASKLAFSDYPGSADGVSITYPSGSGALCPGNVIRKSILNIKCDNSAGDGIIDSMSESSTPPCTYTINMRSKWACPIQPGKPPKTGGGGLSPGSIILIIVACLIPVYLVVGAIVKWKVYGAEPMSIDIIPNVDFWTALPFLVKDGSVYFVRKVTCNRVCGEYSEI